MTITERLHSLLAPARKFQQDLLNSFQTRRYATLQLVEALASAEKPTSVVELCQEGAFQRTFSNVHKAIDGMSLKTIDPIFSLEQRDPHRTASPGEVKRVFGSKIFPYLGSPSRKPLSRGKSLGRAKGVRLPKRQRHKPVKKGGGHPQAA
jgi:hypothetical protein